MKNQNENEKEDAPRTTQRALNNKNEAFGRNLGFLLMKRGIPWASPSFDACTSWGDMRGIPKLEL